MSLSSRVVPDRAIPVMNSRVAVGSVFTPSPDVMSCVRAGMEQQVEAGDLVNERWMELRVLGVPAVRLPPKTNPRLRTPMRLDVCGGRGSGNVDVRAGLFQQVEKAILRASRELKIARITKVRRQMKPITDGSYQMLIEIR